MIYLTNILKSFGGRPLYDGINLQIKERDKIGLVGRNGAGKSTLLKLLMGHYSPDEGEVSFPKGTTIGYLPQDIEVNSDKSVIEETRTAFDELMKKEKRLEEIQEELTGREDYESDGYLGLINQLNDIQQQIQLSGGYETEEKMERVLKGLGFKQKDLEMPVTTFSGGWQMRIELAKILLRQPSLVLLDEPTNHLDIESITWLEGFLKDYPGAIIMVSHDRTFLDNVTNRTVELVLGKAHDYRAPYSKYVDLREERMLAQENAKKNQDRDIAQMERNIERFRAKKNKAKFAQTLIRKLDKMERVELDDVDVKSFRMRFNQVPPSGKIVFEAKGLCKNYGEKKVIRNEEFYINKGDRIAFVGKNGMGKTTLSRILVGDLDYTGNLRTGEKVEVGYYAQHQADSLDGEKTVFQLIDDVATGDMRSNVRSLLGAFLFSGDDQLKKVKVLSGGEKSRLALAKLLLDPVNLLVLDEPTNHLDMISKDMLKEALINYAGTLIVVSHDRHFLQDLTTRVFEFTEKGVKEHPGDINAFLESHKAKSFRDFEATPAKKPAANKEQPVEKEKPGLSYNERKKREKELRRLRNKVSNCEKRIAVLESAIQEVEDQLKDPEYYQKVASDQNFFLEYDKKKQELETEMAAWEAAMTKVEAYERENPLD